MMGAMMVFTDLERISLCFGGWADFGRIESEIEKEVEVW